MRIIETVVTFGDVRISPVKNAIIISSQNTSFAFKPKKTALEIEFLLNKIINQLPVYKTFCVSKYKVAYFVKPVNPGQIDDQIISLLKKAYLTVTEK